MNKVHDLEKNKRLLQTFLQDEIKNMVKTTLEEIAKEERDLHMEADKNPLGSKEEEEEEEEKKNTNRKNGYYDRSLMTQWGKLENVKIPRDRDGSFRPFFLSRYQRNLFSLSELVLAMYQEGLSTRRVSKVIYRLTEYKYSPAWVSRITQVCRETLSIWQERKLRRYYPFVFVDGQFLKIRRKTVASEAVLIAVGIDMDGRKEVLGFCFPGAKESSTLYRELLTKLRSRGLRDPLCFIGDGLSGLEEVVRTLFPRSDFQRCMVHQMRHTLLKIRRGEREWLAADMRSLLEAEDSGAFEKKLLELDAFWNRRYPRLWNGWKDNMESLTAYLKYPKILQSHIYSTNILERFNKEVKRRVKVIEHFPNETSAENIVYLVSQEWNETQWHRCIKGWYEISPLLVQMRKERFGLEELNVFQKVDQLLKEVVV